MLRSLTCIALVFVTSFAASAESRARKSAPLTVLKDCTRFNGNWGYYGNPWCTKAEQAAWDRATARRTAR